MNRGDGGGDGGMFIGGVRVRFPVKPYPSQIAMMAQIIKGLNKSENCLLESPTGTGKSLALLCSTLAWHKAEQDKVNRYNCLIDQGITDQDILDSVYSPASHVSSNTPLRDRFRPPSNAGSREHLLDQSESCQVSYEHAQPSWSAASCELSKSSNNVSVLSTCSGSTKVKSTANVQLGGGFFPDSSALDDDADFRSSGVPFNNTLNESAADETVGSGRLITDVGLTGEFDDNPPQARPPPRKKKAPRIFFGTRTHKQLAQIVREFRRTSYNSVKSVVLGSREHYCIHPVVSKSRNKVEGCKALLDKQESDFCSYYASAVRISCQEQMASYGLPNAWDVEDLVKAGRRGRVCPYFASKQLLEEARIVFCPYNYIVDPLIRKSMNMDVRGHIVVLDEGHNMEDSSREAASASHSQENLLAAKNDLEKMVYNGLKTAACQPLIKLLSNLCLWMESHKDGLTDYSEFRREGKIFSGREMIDQLKNMDVDSSTLRHFEKSLSDLLEEDDEEEEQSGVAQLKVMAATKQVLEGLFLSLKLLLGAPPGGVDDFRVALVRTQVFSAPQKNSGGWLSRVRSKSAGGSADFEYSLNFWCLNPGVIFSQLGVMARTIVLTSGTLSPMGSFESELQVKFKIKFEAGHVIKPEQAWIGSIATGPTNTYLNSTYKSSETFSFQDELGKLVLDVCRTIPRGILLFLPSYAMMDKLVQRWQNTSVWEEISRVKVAIVEPRGNAADFESSIKLYYETIKSTRAAGSEGADSVNGALFVAVCRGKVSEGLDFADDNARAVVVVGIPYPNYKDIQVDLKMKFNDKNSKSRGLLSGRDWYEIQAYRALNQALGRCIRHRGDWGAILLVDERFQKSPRYAAGLSKWVRVGLKKQESHFNHTLECLKNFASTMQDCETRLECSDLQKPAKSEPKFLSPPPLFNKLSKTSSEEATPKRNSAGIKMDDSLTESCVNDSQGVPLTPVCGHINPFSSQMPEDDIFPKASTQKSYRDRTGLNLNQESHRNPENIIKHDLSIPGGERVYDDKFYSVFRSLSKRRKSFNFKSNNRDFHPSTPISSNKPCHEKKDSDIVDISHQNSLVPNYAGIRFSICGKGGTDQVIESPSSFISIDGDQLVKHESSHKTSAESGYKSDDLFGEDIPESTSGKLKEIDFNSPKANVRNKSKLNRKRKEKIEPVHTSDDISSRPLTATPESDLDDFNLDTSFVGGGKKSKQRRRLKGAHFTDFDQA